MKFFTKWLTRLSEYLITYGAFGLFAVALLDSTFVPLPSSADALMLLLSTTNPSWMLLYAFMATSGSALGCWILYLISRRAGARALNRFSEAKQQRVKNWIEKYDAFAVLVATLLPPPFPFTAVVAAAAAFQYPRTRMIAILLSARMLRFCIIGVLAIAFGRQILRLAELPAVHYGLFGLLIICIGGSVLSLIKWFRHSR